MKIITLLSAFVLMSSNSCGDTTFDAADGKRSSVSGVILDQNSNGISDMDVVISYSDDILGITSTDTDGFYEATIIEPKDGISFLTIENSDSNRKYSTTSIRYRFDSPKSTRHFDIPDMALSEMALVTFILDNPNNLDVIVDVNYIVPFCEIRYEEDVLSSSNCDDAGNRRIQFPNANELFTKLGSTITVFVTVNGNTTVTDYLINQENYEVFISV